MELIVGEKYRLREKLGHGSFGDVYLGTDLVNGEEVAIKIECVGARHPLLLHEAGIYRNLTGVGMYQLAFLCS